MSLSREDLWPLLSIAAAGSLGVVLTAGLLESSTTRADEEVEVRLEFTYDSDDSEALRAARRAAWASSLESVRDLIEEAEALREQQRRISREVARLYEVDAAGRAGGRETVPVRGPESGLAPEESIEQDLTELLEQLGGTAR